SLVPTTVRVATLRAAMTIFVASLFLPFTVNFDAPNSSRPQSPELVRPPTAVSQTSLNEPQPVSLFTPNAGIAGPLTQTPGPIPPTPGGTTDHEKIFRPH